MNSLIFHVSPECRITRSHYVSVLSHFSQSVFIYLGLFWDVWFNIPCLTRTINGPKWVKNSFFVCGQAFIALLRGLRARTQTRRNSVCRIVHMRERVSECAFNTVCIDPLITLLRCGIACAQTRHDSVRRIVCVCVCVYKCMCERESVY